MNLWRACLIGLLVLSFGIGPISAQERRALRYGADAEGGAPYIFKDSVDPNKTIGFEVDLVQALAKELGRPIEHRQFGYEALVQGLERGDFDFAMNGLEVTPDRAARLRLSRPYYLYTLQLVVRKDDDRFASLEDLKKAGANVGTMGDTAASRLLEKEAIRTTYYDSQAEPYLDLALGRTDAVLLDAPIAQYFAAPNPALKMAGPRLALGAYAILFRQKDEALAKEFDDAIERLHKSGELEQIYRKWKIWNDDQLQLGGEAPDASILAASSEGLTPGKYLPLLFAAAWLTIKISVSSMLLAVGIGLLVACARLYGPAPLRWLAIGYVEFFRGIPVLLLLFFLYFGLPTILAQAGITWAPGPMLVAVVTFGLNYAAYEAEIYRGGLGSIAAGQWEAAASLGMTRWQTFHRIVLPQTWRVVLPPMTNDFVALFKDTSLVSVIGLTELTKQYLFLSKSSMKYVELGLATAAIYLLMSVPLGYLSRWMEARLAKG
jgi:polar amino acid transport system substrate-binding protein